MPAQSVLTRWQHKSCNYVHENLYLRGNTGDMPLAEKHLKQAITLDLELA